MKTDRLFVVSGPSGAGKDSVISALFENSPEIKFSISTITRPMRPGETEGDKYHFTSVDDFRRTIENGGFLEYAVYCGNYYGTPKAPIDKWLEDGETVLIEVDVQGAEKIMKIYPDANYVFIMPPSLGGLRRRLEIRGTDSKEVIERRVAAAVMEIRKADKYGFVIINRDGMIKQAGKEFSDIINGTRTGDLPETIEKIISEVLHNA